MPFINYPDSIAFSDSTKWFQFTADSSAAFLVFSPAQTPAGGKFYIQSIKAFTDNCPASAFSEIAFATPIEGAFSFPLAGISPGQVIKLKVERYYGSPCYGCDTTAKNFYISITRGVSSFGGGSCSSIPTSVCDNLIMNPSFEFLSVGPNGTFFPDANQGPGAANNPSVFFQFGEYVSCVDILCQSPDFFHENNTTPLFGNTYPFLLGTVPTFPTPTCSSSFSNLIPQPTLDAYWFPPSQYPANEGYIGMQPTTGTCVTPEVINMHLTNPLQAGRTYLVMADFASLGELGYGGRLSMRFHNFPLSTFTMTSFICANAPFSESVGFDAVAYNPADPWRRVAGTFTPAIGGETEVAIGNLTNNNSGGSNTFFSCTPPTQHWGGNYHLIDNLVVKLLADAGPDITDCPGTQHVIGPSCPVDFDPSTGNTATYSWSPTTGLSNPNIPNPTATITTPQTYTVTVTVNVEGVILSATDEVTLTPTQPIITFTYPACKTVELGFTNCTGAYTVNWDFGDGNTGTGNPATHVYSNAGTYTVTGTFLYNGQVISILQQNVTVTGPVFTVNPLTGPAGTVFTPNPSTGFTYTWNGPGGMPFTAPTVTSNTTYTITATDANGCTGTVDVVVTASIPTVCSNFYLNTGITPQIISGNVTASSLGWVNNQVFSNQNFFLDNNAILNIDINVTFDHCHFICYDGSMIYVVLPGGDMVSDNGTIFEGCNKLWKGINTITKLRVFNSIIRDAQYGVYVNGAGGSGELRDNLFEDNLHGIRISGAFNNNSIITGNSFTNPNTLLGPYPGQGSGYIDRSYTGIWLTNPLSVTVGDNASNANVFDGLNCGIWSASGFTRVFNSRFLNILPLGISPPNIAGYAINASSATINTGGNSLRVDAWVGDATGNETFVHCKKGIYLKNYSLLADQTVGAELRMSQIQEECIRGLDLSNCSITANRNILSSGQYGIYLTNLENAVAVTLGSNEITSGGAFNYVSGIQMQSSNPLVSGGPNCLINDNILNLNNWNSFGIRVRNLASPVVRDNIINLDHINGGSNPISRFRSIAVSNCQSPIVNCNESVLANGNPVSVPYGFADIEVENCPQSTVACNQVEATNRNIYYRNNCNASTIENNRMSSNLSPTNNYGFFLDAGAVMGFQPPNQTDPPRNNEWGLNHTIDAFSGNPQPDIFYCLYPNAPYWTNNATIGFVMQSSNSQGVPSCIVQGTCPVTPPNGPQEGGQEELIALGTYPDEEFTEEQNFKLQKDLYNKIDDYNFLADSNLVLNWFYTDNDEGTFAKIKDASDILKQRQNHLTQLLGQIHGLYAQIEIHDLQMNNALSFYQSNPNIQNYNQWISDSLQHDSLLVQLNQMLADCQYINQGYLNAALQFNQEISPESEIAVLEKSINSIYLSKILPELELNAAELEELNRIAWKCPDVFGNPVLVARTILEELQSGNQYNDSIICTQLSNQRKHQKKTVAETNVNLHIIQLKALPNPFSNQFTVVLPSQNTASVLRLLDQNNRLLKTLVIPAETSTLTIDATELSSGSYYLEWQHLMGVERCLLIKF